MICITHDLVVEKTHRLIPLDPTMQLPAIVVMHRVAIKFLFEEAIWFGLYLPRQVNVPLRILHLDCPPSLWRLRLPLFVVVVVVVIVVVVVVVGIGVVAFATADQIRHVLIPVAVVRDGIISTSVVVMVVVAGCWCVALCRVSRGVGVLAV